jgi:hypothetical protein
VTHSFISVPAIAQRLLPGVEPGRALATAEWLVLTKVAEVLLEGGSSDASPEQVASNVERFLVEGRSRRAWRCRVLLHLIEWSPLPTHGRRFSELLPGERRRLVEERFVEGSHVYRLCAKVRYLVLMGAYGDERSAPATGYVPLAERARFRAVASELEPAAPPRLRLVRLGRTPRVVREEGSSLA